MYCSCGSPQPVGAKVCVKCGGDIGNVAASSDEPSALQLYQVASSFRDLVVWFGVQWLGAILVRAVKFSQISGSPVGSSLQLIFALTMVVGSGICIFVIAKVIMSVYRLAGAMGLSTPVLWAIGIALPCFSLVCLLMINGKATSWLAERGVKVGFLGPSKEAVEELRQRATTTSL